MLLCRAMLLPEERATFAVYIQCIYIARCRNGRVWAPRGTNQWSAISITLLERQPDMQLDPV